MSAPRKALVTMAVIMGFSMASNGKETSTSKKETSQSSVSTESQTSVNDKKKPPRDKKKPQSQPPDGKKKKSK